jgi:hypothetical protein
MKQSFFHYEELGDRVLRGTLDMGLFSIFISIPSKTLVLS